MSMKARLKKVEKRNMREPLPEIIFCRNKEEIEAARKRKNRAILFIRDGKQP
ncbi:MAG: hypothetical protein KKI01_10060 [Proteobacteria bacterium]|nr:hypothetical protein [Pseudomonadota bacterium]